MAYKVVFISSINALKSRCPEIKLEENWKEV